MPTSLQNWGDVFLVWPDEEIPGQIIWIFFKLFVPRGKLGAFYTLKFCFGCQKLLAALDDIVGWKPIKSLEWCTKVLITFIEYIERVQNKEQTLLPLDFHLHLQMLLAALFWKFRLLILSKCSVKALVVVLYCKTCNGDDGETPLLLCTCAWFFWEQHTDSRDKSFVLETEVVLKTEPPLNFFLVHFWKYSSFVHERLNNDTEPGFFSEPYNRISTFCNVRHRWNL